MNNPDKHSWADLRETAIEAFNGETPGPQLEQDIIQAFVQDPERVQRTIRRIAAQHARKPLGSPWAVTRADLARTAQADVVASSASSRQKTLDRATAWIRNAGHHHPTWADAATHLFGDPATTPQLEFLEQLDHDTRNRPGRHLYGPLLTATIADTRANGPRTIPPNPTAIAASLRNDHQARALLEAEWNQHQTYDEIPW